MNASLSRSSAGPGADLHEIIDRALGDCLKLTRSGMGYVDLVDAEGYRELVIHKGADVDDAFVAQFRGLRVHARLATAVLVKRKVMISNDLASDSDSLGVPDRHPPVRTFMGAPLVVGEQTLGMVAMANKCGQYTAQDAELLCLVSNQLAVVIAYSRLYEEQRRMHIELQGRIRESADHAASDERQRLARELHDSATQSLYGIALAAQSVRRTVEREPIMEPLKEPLDYITELAETGLAEMRALIFGLRPESVAEKGLAAGLRQLTAAIAARHRLTIDLVAETEPDLDVKAKETLYRIAQEALQNVIKHASARSVKVWLLAQGQAVELRIIDDGVGFNGATGDPGHIGLSSMKERAQASNLEVTIDAHPGGGVEVRVRTHALPRRSSRTLPWS